VVRHTWPDPFVATGPEYATDVMTTPIVVQLADDNCDGVVDERDVPDILFSTFSNGAYATTGTLHALSVRDGRLVEAWQFEGVVAQLQIAGADFHPSFGGEVVACGADGSVVALSATGTELWRRAGTACWMPALADLDQNGDVEVVVEGGILDGATGTLEHAFTGAPLRSTFTVADLDGDTRLDVVTGYEAFRGDGTLLASTGTAIGPGDRVGLPAVVDLDVDGRPEVVGDGADERGRGVEIRRGRGRQRGHRPRAVRRCGRSRRRVGVDDGHGPHHGRRLRRGRPPGHRLHRLPRLRGPQRGAPREPGAPEHAEQ
jgi:hypothetical protein